MKVRIVTNNPLYRRDAVIDLEESEAIRLVTKGQAVPVAVKPTDERETR